MKPKLIRITTIPISLEKLLGGQLRFMNNYFDVIAVSSDNEKLRQVGEKEQVATFHLEMTRKITPIKDCIAVVKLYFFLIRTKPAIVHTHTPKAGIIGMLASKLAGVPYRLHTVAGLPLVEAKGIKRKVLDFVERATYACATKVYPNSFGLLEIIKENRYCDFSKLKVLANGSSNGIDTSYFNKEHFTFTQNNELRKTLKIDQDDFVFIFVGRIVADKGINELVSAFLDLINNNSKVKLLLVGPLEEDLNPLKPEVLKEIQSNPSIISVGYKNDVRPYFSVANCLVFPSYREGFPNVVMQASAMELPCIVSDINGCNEIISTRENGLIIPVKNQDALFGSMNELLSNSDLFNTLKSNSRSRIVSNYEQHVVWNAILEEYNYFNNAKVK
ncbi:glycosyltransferase family 4 protein [Flavobacterium sp. SUN052]|uniref:glycosyltransferase family 4 protein n=1 Tax=Flavobacterium sp. SUN052 TaxID=3002441 RepID=UPI00237E060C|nr:glycosyltransferase family 4 protein [Flavobacterium sp. SUN052]MEC4004415.1 glycosyltransferase family 4 protein [Flavobacterium sp. SUN052]